MTEVKISNYKMNVFFNEKTIRFIVEANIMRIPEQSPIPFRSKVPTDSV